MLGQCFELGIIKSQGMQLTLIHYHHHQFSHQHNPTSTHLKIAENFSESDQLKEISAARGIEV